MAGLFGLDLFPNANSTPSGGLFGGGDPGAPPNKWIQALGLLGSTLQDVGSNGRSDHLSQYQAAMQALADKAQKDAIAQRLGDAFNTQPVQAPAVNVPITTGADGNTTTSNMPLDFSSVMNAVNGTDNSGLPKLDGNVPSVKTLAPLYAQAISAGVDPSPYMSLQKMASQQQPRLLSPTEAQAMHLPNAENQTYAIGADGIPKPVGTADVKSEAAIQQKIALENANPQLAISRASQAETARHNRASEAQGDTPPDPNTVKYWAQSVAGGAPMPTLGMGKQAAGYRQAILTEVARMQGAGGKTGADQNAVTGSYKANLSTLGKITPLRAATEAYENTMLQNMDAAKGMIAKGSGTTGIPVVNRWQRYIKGEYKGDPDVAAFNTAIQTVKNEYAKIQSGSIGNTPVSDASRKEAEGMVNPNMTPQQIIANFDYMRKETGNRARALRAQEGALRSGLSGNSDMPNVPGITDPQAAAPHPADINSLLQKYGVQ